MTAAGGGDRPAARPRQHHHQHNHGHGHGHSHGHEGGSVGLHAPHHGGHHGAPAASLESAPHFRSRFFGPNAGIAEDPVTGSAHCCLAPYWGEQLKLKEVVGFQASARGGVLVCSLTPAKTVKLRGASATVWSGFMSLP